MVVCRGPSRRLPLLLAAALYLAACPVQYYDDYDSRFSWHDEWRFPSDRAPPVSGDYSFIVMSDPHIGGPESAEAFGRIQDRLRGAAFIVIIGDITDDGSREQLELFTGAALGLGIPCYPVPGNHDVYTERGKPWREIIGATSYRVDTLGGDTSLFLLDNATASFGGDQLAWLAGELESAKKHTFVFAHENFFIDASPPDIEQTSDTLERARIMALLKGRCEAMFMGHIHRRMLKEYGGVRYITLEAFGETKNFCRVRVSASGVSYDFEGAE